MLVTPSGQRIFNCLGVSERERCWVLGKRNAVCTLRQAYTGLMYVSVQPG
ncbi:hypothetical protein [Deinococcus sp. UR1]|nr:hypothetical protein [Deinococcus sp. UR1]